MMNDCLINQIGLISPPLRNAYLYKSSSELDTKIDSIEGTRGLSELTKIKKG
jgi:hypothetical protein